MSMLLEVKGLFAGYGGIPALHGLDFNLEEGGVTTLLGANGAGKTTTLRALCGMIRARGDANFAGKRLIGMQTEDIVRLMPIDGADCLYYKAFPIDVAIVRGTTADLNGNITMEKEALTLEALSIAMAAGSVPRRDRARLRLAAARRLSVELPAE